MAFRRPTLAQLIQRARADIASELEGADASLRGSTEDVLAISSAGMTHGLHGHLVWLSKQLLPDLSESEFLLRWADIYGLEKTPAVKTTGDATITGTNDAVCPEDTLWQRSDGAQYTQTAAATIAGGTATISLEAVVSGTDGNAAAATSLTIVAPVEGINSTATVDGNGLTGGVDIEEDEDLRTRLLYDLRTPPSGGGPGDYVRWAKEVSGVTRAWEYANMMGVGSVGVRFVCDDQGETIIPDASKIEEVQDYIETLAPIATSGQLYVVAPTEKVVNITASITPNTTAVKAAAEEQLAALFAEQEPGDTVYLSKINEAISLASGEEDHILTLPAANVTCTTGEIAVLGSVTWS